MYIHPDTSLSVNVRNCSFKKGLVTEGEKKILSIDLEFMLNFSALLILVRSQFIRRKQIG